MNAANEPVRPVVQNTTATVSVVVPTRNRPKSVVRAVRSALDQIVPPHEVVVVVDGPDDETINELRSIGDDRVVTVELERNGGAARARNIGVMRSTGEWIAFLDDDDEWLPGKLGTQLNSVSATACDSRLVLATGVERRRDAASDWWPLRPPKPGERVSDYLFVRKRPGEGMLQTSTVMLRREFAQRCPIPEHLSIHEEWDWFLELERAGGKFSVIMEPLVVFHAPSVRASVSSNAHWDTSLSWVLSRRRDMSKRAFSDFCMTEVARLAKSSGGLRAQIAVFAVAASGRLHWFSVVRFVVVCLFPARLRQRVSARASATPSAGDLGAS